MRTRQDLVNQLADYAPKGGVVLCHTSLRAVGAVEGRGEAVLDALIDYFTADGGLLCIPTHTWANLGKTDRPTCDIQSDETCIGMLPSLAIRDPRGRRSLHPTHSMVVFGDGAEDYIAGEVMVDSSTGVGGCYGRLYERGGHVLLIGVKHNRNTYLHSVEERLGIPNRMSAEKIPATIRLASGDVIERPLHCHMAQGIGDVSAHYVKLEPAFRANGCITDGTLGDAAVQVCSARGMAEVMSRIHARHPGELLADDDPLDAKLYEPLCR